MRPRYWMLLAGLILPLAGCTTDRGGVYDDYDAGWGYDTGRGNARYYETFETPQTRPYEPRPYWYPSPAQSPNWRPGMYRYDPRDPNYLGSPRLGSPSPTVQ